MSEQTGTIRRNVSFKPVDFAIVQMMAKDTGSSFSGGLRTIIREWKTQKRFRAIGQACAEGVISEAEAVKRLAVLTDRK